MITLIAVGLAGCATAASGAAAPPKADDCHMDFFWTAPDRPYVELAAVRAGGGIIHDYQTYQEVIRQQACRLGGDAVIIMLPFSSREGIVIKYREILPPPQ